MAGANIIDKFLLEKRIKNPHVPVIMDGFLALIFSAGIALFYPISDIALFPLALCVISVALFTFVLIFYFKAVQADDVSRIIPLFNLLPLVVLLLSVFVVGHVFSLNQYAGILLLLLGAFVISIEDIRAPRMSPGIIFAFVVVLVGGFNTLLIERLLVTIDFVTVYFYGRIGGFIAAVPLFFAHRKDFMHAIMHPKKSGLNFIILSEAFALFGLMVYTQAYSVEKAALVSAISYAQPVIVFLLVIFLILYFPKIIHEKVNQSNLLQKVIAIGLFTH